MFTVLLPGSFNPPTLGHFKLMEHASLLCSNPYVGTGYRFEKPYSLFSTEEIVELLRDASRLGNVSVHIFNGLVSALSKKLGSFARWCMQDVPLSINSSQKLFYNYKEK